MSLANVTVSISLILPLKLIQDVGTSAGLLLAVAVGQLLTHQTISGWWKLLWNCTRGSVNVFADVKISSSIKSAESGSFLPQIILLSVKLRPPIDFPGTCPHDRLSSVRFPPVLLFRCQNSAVLSQDTKAKCHMKGNAGRFWPPFFYWWDIISFGNLLIICF